MVVAMASDGQKHPATEAIERALADQGRSQGWLGSEVARIEGRANPYSQPATSEWLAKITNQPPGRIFLIEQALSMKEGTLSRLLGFLPTSARPVRTVVEAIAADPRLTEKERRILTQVYEAALEE